MSTHKHTLCTFKEWSLFLHKLPEFYWNLKWIMGGSLHVLNPWYQLWSRGTPNADHFCVVRPRLRYLKRKSTARSRAAHSNGEFLVQKAGCRIWQMAWGALGLMVWKRAMTRMCTLTARMNHTSLTRPKATVRILRHSVSQYYKLNLTVMGLATLTIWYYATGVRQKATSVRHRDKGWWQACLPQQVSDHTVTGKQVSGSRDHATSIRQHRMLGKACGKGAGLSKLMHGTHQEVMRNMKVLNQWLQVESVQWPMA